MIIKWSLLFSFSFLQVDKSSVLDFDLRYIYIYIYKGVNFN